jgi:hypothetical protein
VGDRPPVDLDVTSIALDQQRVLVAVFGSGGSDVLRPDIARVALDPEAATIGSWSMNGDLVGYLRLAGDGASVWVTSASGRDAPVVVDDSGGFGAPLFSADGRYVLYNDAVDSGQGYAEPRATARPLG